MPVILSEGFLLGIYTDEGKYFLVLREVACLLRQEKAI